MRTKGARVDAAIGSAIAGAPSQVAPRLPGFGPIGPIHAPKWMTF
jgi:hypothetical protein